MRFIYTKAFAIFFVSLVLIVLLGFMQAKGWLDPVREAFLQAPRPVVYVVKGVTSPVKNFFSTIYRLRGITQENAQLAQKVAILEQDLVDQDQYKRENDVLKKELGFVNTGKYQSIPCTVLAKNPLGITQTAVINCGKDKGIGEGRAVISQGYLIGKVLYVGENSSTILLINNSKFSTDATISQTGVNGVAEGSFSSGVMLDRLPQNSDVRTGLVVVTGGIDEKIPKNILMGEVGEILSAPNDVFKRATLLSPIDLNAVQFVFVVQ